MRDPKRYRPRTAWLQMVREVAGRSRAGRDALRAWAETSYSTKLDLAHEAPTFVARNRSLLKAYDGTSGLWPAAAAALRGELKLVTGAPKVLTGRIAAQGKTFLDAAGGAAGLAGLGVDVLASERPTVRATRTARGFSGAAAPPDPSRARALVTRMDTQRDDPERNRRQVYGWRNGVGVDVPPYPAPPNVLDVFLDAVAAHDQAWGSRSSDAGSRVTVTLNGRRVSIDSGGRFKLTRTACGRTLTATDGAGGQTALRLRRC
jgi:hypothetical protein